MVATYYRAELASKTADALLEAIEAKANVDGQSVQVLLRLAEASWNSPPQHQNGRRIYCSSTVCFPSTAIRFRAHANLLASTGESLSRPNRTKLLKAVW